MADADELERLRQENAELRAALGQLPAHIRKLDLDDTSFQLDPQRGTLMVEQGDGTLWLDFPEVRQLVEWLRAEAPELVA